MNKVSPCFGFETSFKLSHANCFSVFPSDMTFEMCGQRLLPLFLLLLLEPMLLMLVVLVHLCTPPAHTDDDALIEHIHSQIVSFCLPRLAE